MRLYVKRAVSLLLCLIMTFSVCAGAAVSAEAAANDPACTVNELTRREAHGMIVSFLYRFFDLFYRLSAVTIQKPAPLPDKTSPAGGVPAVDPAQPAVQTETWRAFELAFTAAKPYADPSVARRVNTTETGGISTGTVGSLKPNAEYKYQWFDPIAGKYGEAGTFRSTVLGTYYLGEKPSGTDWAVRITPVL